MTPAKKTTAPADASEKKKEYKYQQEISQMVRTQTQSRAPGPPPTVFGCSRQMFVFGEIQEPLTDTVNLVENIIKSQLVELVRSFPLRFHESWRSTLPVYPFRLFKRVH